MYPASPAVPVLLFGHSCTLQTRYMLLVQNPYFSSPIIHVLRFADNHVLSFDDQLVLDARDDYRLSDNSRRLVWLLNPPPPASCGILHAVDERTGRVLKVAVLYPYRIVA